PAPLLLPPFPTRRSSDLGAYAGVVKHLLGQGDNGFQPVVLDDPAADFAFTAARATGKERRAIKDYANARARFFLVPGLIRLELRSEEHTSELQSRENLVC